MLIYMPAVYHEGITCSSDTLCQFGHLSLYLLDWIGGFLFVFAFLFVYFGFKSPCWFKYQKSPLFRAL